MTMLQFGPRPPLAFFRMLAGDSIPPLKDAPMSNAPDNQAECRAVEPGPGGGCDYAPPTPMPDACLEPNVKFASGAVRGTNALPLHLVSPHALYALASAFAEGAIKYTEYNNLKGFPLSVCYDHALDHLQRFWWGDTSEDHLGHAIWNLCQMAHQQGQARIELDDRPLSRQLQGVDWTPPDVGQMLHAMDRVKRDTAEIVARVKQIKSQEAVMNEVRAMYDGPSRPITTRGCASGRCPPRKPVSHPQVETYYPADIMRLAILAHDENDEYDDNVREGAVAKLKGMCDLFDLDSDEYPSWLDMGIAILEKVDARGVFFNSAAKHQFDVM